MTTIFNTLKEPDGDGLRNILVAVSLSWDTDVASIAAVASATPHFVVDDVSYAQTDADGYWSMTVTPNSLIVPVGSVYKIVETISDDNVNTYYVNVPDQTEVWVGSAIAAKPSWED